MEKQTGKALKARTGQEWPAGIYLIEREALQRFLRAIDDPNPQWQKDGPLPPTFLVTLGFDRIEQELAVDPRVTLLHGSTELECYQPVRVGDTLSIAARIVDVREREGRRGKTTFVTFELAYRNEGSELVARCRQMLITREGYARASLL